MVVGLVFDGVKIVVEKIGMAYGFADVNQATTTQTVGLDVKMDVETNELRPVVILSVHVIAVEANVEAVLSEAAKKSKTHFEVVTRHRHEQKIVTGVGFVAVIDETVKIFHVHSTEKPEEIEVLLLANPQTNVYFIKNPTTGELRIGELAGFKVVEIYGVSYHTTHVEDAKVNETEIVEVHDGVYSTNMDPVMVIEIGIK